MIFLLHFLYYCSFLMEPLCEATVFLLTQRHEISFFYKLVMAPGKADGSNKRGKSAMQLSLFGAGEGQVHLQWKVVNNLAE